MYALISPQEEARYISEWSNTKPYSPIYTVVGQRVADISTNEFPVANPLFWVTCEDTVIPDHYYYDATNKTINKIPTDITQTVPQNTQPTTTGTTTI